MQVEVIHESDHSCCENEPYTEEVPDNATLQEIWDIVNNGGTKTDELDPESWEFETVSEGEICYDDNNESSAGSRITITWPARH
jgi:hypothetical protein